MTAHKLITIALLGASGTGKKSLAQALTQTLAAHFSTTPSLRWQVTEDTPLQRLLELFQMSANQRDGIDIDVGTSAYQAALTQHHGFDYTFLMGLDLMPPALARSPQSAGEHSHIDTLLRRSLVQAGLPFQVIYGTGDERLAQALAALKLPAAKPETSPEAISRTRKPWVWACDKCSDPVCEHRLLSDLLLNR